jgi:hypothetical protein
VFPTKELRDEAVEKHHAIEDGQQTLSNLTAYVTEIVRRRRAGVAGGGAVPHAGLRRDAREA